MLCFTPGWLYPDSPLASTRLASLRQIKLTRWNVTDGGVWPVTFQRAWCWNASKIKRSQNERPGYFKGLQSPSHGHIRLILNYARVEPRTKFNLSSDLKQPHCPQWPTLQRHGNQCLLSLHGGGCRGYSFTQYFLELMKRLHEEMRLNSAQAWKLYWLGHGRNWQIDCSSSVVCVSVLGCTSRVQSMEHFNATQWERLCQTKICFQSPAL